MSFRGSPINRTLKRTFPFTRWGALFLLLALIVLTVAILRMELATLLWAGAFVLLALYCLAVSHLFILVLRRHLNNRPDPLDCTLTPGGLFPGSHCTAEIKADLPRRQPPGFCLSFEMALRWEGGPDKTEPGRCPLLLRAPLGAGQNRGTVELSPQHRGCYRSREALIVVGDLLGFTRAVIGYPMAETLRVYPSVLPERRPSAPSPEGGEEERRRQRRRRSDELLEVRKYFPGDDIRKIHWKVFAHTAELFLKVGEEVPPPQARFLVLLDAGASASVPAGLKADYLDALVEACASAVLDLAARGFQVLFSTSDGGAPRPITQEKTRELLQRLAEQRWTDSYSLELPPGQSFRQVLLFSSPGSRNLQRLIRELQARGRQIQLFLKDLPVAGPQAPRQPLRELFFIPEPGKGKSRRAADERELGLFREALDQGIGLQGRRIRVEKV